jgi:hypothetical protein
MNSIQTIKDQITRLPDDWHTAGPLSTEVLDAIVYHAEGIAPINVTVETGAGKSTLLFSHLSQQHFCFAIAERNKSILAVKESPLFKAEKVTFVEGPTQKTLPTYQLPKNIQIALIDGPHGYPFPDLEYFYFYQKIVQGGLLIIDDIQIPSVKKMFDIIKADNMFRLLKVYDETAFFKRTNAPLLDPYGDGWWLQGFNRSHFIRMENKSKAIKRVKAIIPQLSELKKLFVKMKKQLPRI